MLKLKSNRKDISVRCFLVELLREFIDFDPNSSVKITIKGQKGKYTPIMEFSGEEVHLSLGSNNGLKLSMGKTSNLREFLWIFDDIFMVEDDIDDKLEEVMFEYTSYLGEKRSKVEDIEKFKKSYELIEGYFCHNCLIVPTPDVYLDDYPEEYLIEDLVRSISDDL